VGTRVDYDWGEGLTEWWHNGPSGVKQTFVLAQRPAPGVTAGPLALRVAMAAWKRGDGRSGDSDLHHARLPGAGGPCRHSARASPMNGTGASRSTGAPRVGG
jgi:hypothetical protein